MRKFQTQTITEFKIKTHCGQFLNRVIRSSERSQTDLLRKLSEAGLCQQRHVTQQLMTRVPAYKMTDKFVFKSTAHFRTAVRCTHGSGVYKGSELCRTYWVQWKTRKAKPARKSRGDRYPATGLMVNPVRSEGTFLHSIC